MLYNKPPIRSYSLHALAQPVNAPLEVFIAAAERMG